MLAGARAWMISAHSGPIRCTPRTLSVSASTISFMKPRPSLPLIVFFIGLHCTFQGLRFAFRLLRALFNGVHVWAN